MRQLRQSQIALALALLLAAIPGCHKAVAAEATVLRSKGSLLIVGGGTQPPELVAKFVELAGGAGKARIAVVPMASGDAAAAGKDKAEQLRGLGADAFVLVTGREGADADSLVRLLDRATGIWFNGGDQSRLVKAIGGSRVLAAIHARYQAGAVVGGTSAGAAIMSDSMLTGDQIRPDSTGYYGDDYPSIARKSIVITGGFGFLPGTVVDQHFLRRERHNRLVSAVLERPSLVGIGVDEGTAVLVHPSGTWEVLGKSVAVVYDARRARVTPPDRGALGASEIRFHLLPAGATFDPRSGLATLPDR